jgi:hypothetical protein
MIDLLIDRPCRTLGFVVKNTSKSFAVYSSEPVRMAHRASSRSEYIHLYDGGSANNPCSADTDAPTIR